MLLFLARTIQCSCGVVKTPMSRAIAPTIELTPFNQTWKTINYTQFNYKKNQITDETKFTAIRRQQYLFCSFKERSATGPCVPPQQNFSWTCSFKMDVFLLYKFNYQLFDKPHIKSFFSSIGTKKGQKTHTFLGKSSGNIKILIELWLKVVYLIVNQLWRFLVSQDPTNEKSKGQFEYSC